VLTTLVEARGLSNPLVRSKIADYVVNRQNEDGGYTFGIGEGSSIQDTYYGLAILRSLGSPFPNVEKTISFVRETRLDNDYQIYYVAKASKLLETGFSDALGKRVAAIIGSDQYFGSTDAFSEVSSEFITTHMALELADLLKLSVEGKKVSEWLLLFRNEDGGFGIRGQSNINSTYYAVASINLSRSGIKNPVETVKFVRSCEKPYGGFTVIPINFMPYIEHTYFGVMTLDLLGEKSLYPKQSADWVLTCQNNNGGFARSDLGISSFADTCHAVAILQKLAQTQEPVS
jgi:hypothetical protein